MIRKMGMRAYLDDDRSTDGSQKLKISSKT